MSQPSDLFSRLKDYEIPPPAEAFAMLKNRLIADDEKHFPDEEQGSLQKLQRQEIAPPPFLHTAVSAAISALPELCFLQPEEINPPAGTFDRISANLAAKAVKQKRFVQVSGSFLFRMAAASFLLLLAGWGGYRFMATQRKPSAAMAQHNVKKTTSSSQVSQPPADTACIDQSLHANQQQDNTSYINYFKNNRFRNGSSMYSLVDNDFIITFTSVDSPELQAFFTNEENKEWVIRLDQYSHFSISPRMVEQLKKMYQKKSNGAPTRKARKEKEKLEQWKKSDEKRFDEQKGNNALDVIDLAEFIFK